MLTSRTAAVLSDNELFLQLGVVGNLAFGLVISYTYGVYEHTVLACGAAVGRSIRGCAREMRVNFVRTLNGIRDASLLVDVC